MINGLEEFKERIGQFSEKQKEVYERELNYFKTRRRRFKLTGQFWSMEGDETFPALSRNRRWSKLFPCEKPCGTDMRIITPLRNIPLDRF